LRIGGTAPHILDLGTSTSFVIAVKLVKLIKMCLNETYIVVCIGKNLSNAFHPQNDLEKNETLYFYCFSSFL